MAERRSSSLRLVAPVALVVAAFALVVVLVSSDVTDDGERPTGERTSESASATNDSGGEGAERDAPTDATYRVRAGDTLAGIAERTGVELEELQRLNPDLDPQTLATGQRIKLR